MLSKEDNELLCRVGPGTAMGDLLRQYWLPVLLSTELPEPDSPPLRVHLLGEDLIAFRDSDGRVGLLAANCPHRGASLFFGRNEECGLRCVYHGWKFDVGGRCIDMPSEPPESNFKDKVRALACPCEERNGIVWAYMGPVRPLPGLPAFEWSLLPDEQRYISKRVQECNWVQALEGGIDSSHGAFLHALLKPEEYLSGSFRQGRVYSSRERYPHYEVVDTEYGSLLGARRSAEADSYYWRITHFLLPFYNMFPPYGPNPSLGGLAWVPMDDERTMVWSLTWHPTRPLRDAERPTLSAGRGPNAGSVSIHAGLDDLLPPTSAPGGAWRPKANRDNDYFQDREAQRTERFSGVPSVWAQDVAVQESMGPIYDRTQEHLGTSDAAIIAVRQRWLQAARALRDQGTMPDGVLAPDAYAVRPAAVVLPREASWVEGSRDWTTARPGVHLDAV